MAGSRRRTLGIIVGVAVLVVAAAGFAGWWFLIRDDAPPEADIETAGETLDEQAGADASGGIEGDWTVDTSVGSFDDFSGTWAGYRFDEELRQHRYQHRRRPHPRRDRHDDRGRRRGHRRRRRGRPHDAPERQRHPRRLPAVARARVRHVPDRHLLPDRAPGPAGRGRRRWAGHGRGDRRPHHPRRDAARHLDGPGRAVGHHGGDRRPGAGDGWPTSASTRPQGSRCCRSRTRARSSSRSSSPRDDGEGSTAGGGPTTVG